MMEGGKIGQEGEAFGIQVPVGNYKRVHIVYYSITMPAQVDQTSGIAEILLAQGSLPKEQYDRMKLESMNTGEAVEALVVKYNLVDEAALAKAKAEYYKIPYVNLREVGASPEALNQFSEQVARRHKVFPFGLDKVNNVLSVAMVNPLDLTAIEFLQAKSGNKIAPFLAAASDVTRAIDE